MDAAAKSRRDKSPRQAAATRRRHVPGQGKTRTTDQEIQVYRENGTPTVRTTENKIRTTDLGTRRMRVTPEPGLRRKDHRVFVGDRRQAANHWLFDNVLWFMATGTTEA